MCEQKKKIFLLSDWKVLPESVLWKFKVATPSKQRRNDDHHHRPRQDVHHWHDHRNCYHDHDRHHRNHHHQHHHHHNLQQVSVLWKVPSGASERTSRIKVAWLPQMQSNDCICGKEKLILLSLGILSELGFKICLILWNCKRYYVHIVL